MKIVIVDYGMGNLRSVEKALNKVGINAEISSQREAIFTADGLVVPGVGAFGDAMAELQRLNLVDALREQAAKGVPLLGICLGLQILLDESEEAPGMEGLRLVRGRVRRFSPTLNLKIPHMGWNALNIHPNSRLFAGIAQGVHVYFVHSYYVEPEDPSATAATSDYGIPFTAAVEKDNIFGVQFHPEKSQEVGLNILSNFARLLG